MIICLDALRPDAICPELMPNLQGLQEQAFRFTRHRAAFPSDTRPNAACLVTGTDCAGHGIVGNAFRVDLGDARQLIDTGVGDNVAEMDRKIEGGIFTAVTLAELLAGEGRKLSVVSSASTGTTRLLNHDFRLGAGHVTLHCHDETASFPAELAARVAERFGPPPPESAPDLAAVGYGIDAFLSEVWPCLRPEVCLFWFNEPDVSYHSFGPLGLESRNMLKALDAQIGRLLDWWRVQEPMALILLSDHGQIATSFAVDVIGGLRAAGFDACQAGEGDGEGAVQVVPGGIVQLYAAQAAEVDLLAQWLDAQAWCGLIFSRDPRKGTLPFDIVGYGCDRSADLAFTFRTGQKDGHPVTPYFYPEPVVGMHGGLGAKETEATLLIAPRQAAPGGTADTPSCTADILPTLCKLLGMTEPESARGQSLIDAGSLRPHAAEWRRRRLTASTARRQQELYVFEAGGRRIVDFGTVYTS